jgi:hypothetical protein
MTLTLTKKRKNKEIIQNDRGLRKTRKGLRASLHKPGPYWILQPGREENVGKWQQAQPLPAAKVTEKSEFGLWNLESGS